MPHMTKKSESLTEDAVDPTTIGGLESAAVEMAVAVPSAMLARRFMRRGFEKVTGDPAPDSPEKSNRVPALEAILWLAAVAAAAAAARAIAWRLVVRAHGHPGATS
jgi:Protein of unknown function (DUF4235)